jgi:TPR repeat protein
MKTARPLLAAVLFALPSAAESLSVAEVRSRLTAAEAGLSDRSTLAESVRDVARRTLPDARVLDAAESGGDLQVTGEVLRTEQGLLVTLELREAQSGKLGATASAPASTPEELSDAVKSAAVDLFRAWKETSALAMSPAPVPDAPAASTALQPAGLVSLEMDADLLVAFDEARTADARGEDQPEEAASAWRAVAEARGANPFREAAAARAGEWQSWAENQRAFEDQRSRDTARMRKVLPLAAVTDETKVELLVRYTRAYGLDKAGLLLAVLPAPLRPQAHLAIGCQAKQAGMCVALARAADAANDGAQAAEYFSRACAASDFGSCAEAGDRFLRQQTRDVGRAIPALETGCAGSSAQSCTRLARVYEEGDGTDVDLALAARMRDRACTAGDGPSCRRLACNASDTGAASALWQQGCKDGDPLSCTLASAADPVVRPTPAPAPIAATPVKARAASHAGAGAGFLAVALVTGTGAALIAMQDDGDARGRWWGGRTSLRMGAGAQSDSVRRALPLALGASAAISTVVGLGLMFWHSEPAPGKVSVGVGPGGLAISGSLP